MSLVLPLLSFMCSFQIINYYHQLNVLCYFFLILTDLSASSHFAVTHKPWVWKLVGSVHDFYHGASMYVWIHQVSYD